jgi:hypothetical protein
LLREGVVFRMRRSFRIYAIVVALCAPALLRAQDDDIPLGDLARAFRNSKPPEQTDVIDNDNLDRVMDKAESERLEGQPIFSVTHAGTFVAVSPDGSCSLSFDVRDVNRTAATYITTDLPQSELVKLDGPAAIEDGMLQVSVHNGTQWELKEIVVDLTFMQAQVAPPEYRFATLQSAPVVSSEKLPDPTLLYHLRGTAEPNSTSTFHASLEGSIEGFSAGKDWHWSIVGARGIPPAAAGIAAVQNSTMVSGPLASTPENRTDILDGPSHQGSLPSESLPSVNSSNASHH